MIKTSSKVVRLNNDTLTLIENYRCLLKCDTKNNNILKYIDEMNYDSIIRSAINDAIKCCTKS